MKSNNKPFDFNSTNLLLFLWHWRITLLIIVVAAIGLSALFSSTLFITPKYKSSVIMFPVSTNSISKALISSNNNGKQDIMEFGAEEQAEQDGVDAVLFVHADQLLLLLDQLAPVDELQLFLLTMKKNLIN